MGIYGTIWVFYLRVNTYNLRFNKGFLFDNLGKVNQNENINIDNLRNFLILPDKL